ncbi:MutS-related protein [Lebetimonas sp. JS138]|uniref:MutS-related protein n=1 Tax=Lebetimonas sp. JS138 TaxID=990072 RepID=UPI000465EA16|nr:HNH endonuclease [Lebetimonas sp. JS138]
MDINKFLNKKGKLLTEIYFELQKYYDNLYPNAVVLMEVGTFFETYETDGIGKAREIANILNIQLTKKNKSIPNIDVKNPLMAGFPNHALDRYLEKLIEENKYTLILIKQKGTPPNVKRYLSEIISPGVNLEYSKTYENYVTSIIVEKYNAFHVGYANIDINTGKSYIYENYSTKDDVSFALDELFRLLQTYKSNEIILTLKNVDCDEIVNYLELDGKNIIINRTRMNINYQNEIFKRVYKIHSLLTPIEIMNLEKYPLITESLGILLEFVISHNKDLIKHIKFPELIEDEKFVYLGNNPIKQLEIGKVLKLIDKTKTPMGKRLIKERLFNPIKDEEELKKRYKAVNFMLNRFKKFEELLKDIYDLEKIDRKIKLKRLHPFELSFLVSSLKSCSEIYLLLKKKSLKIDNFLNYIERHFDLNKINVKIEDIKENFFNEGINKELDELNKEKKHYINELVKIKEEIEKLGDVKVELSQLEKEGYYLSLTKTRFNLIKDKFLNTFTQINGKNVFFKDFRIKNLTNSVKISGEIIEEISDKIITLDNKIIKKTTKLYLKKLDEISREFDVLQSLSDEIAQIDVAVSSAKVAKQFNYFMPKISNIRPIFRDLRHPLIEVNQENGIYIPNDIDFNEYDGMLLYGINSSGKSSLMKSVGIAIFLAQSGFFVPAKMEFKPINGIFTRIEAKDNLSKGLSTFAVEMLELKNIFNRADSNSIVLGDEIAHGTETLSAMSIVASAVIKLAKKNINFLFATHLHQLMDLEEIKNLPNVVARHLEVYFDGEKLIYDRKLKEGSGSSVYGLEFAKSIYLDSEFLKTAENIRKKLNEEYSELELLIKKRKSRYNKKVIVTTCAICGAPVDDVHHIFPKEQAEKGFIDHVPVNHKFNLIPLCKKHHKMVHVGKIIITGFVTTSKGIELHWEEKN